MARIVVVEDEVTVLMLAEVFLQDAGHEVLIAVSLPEAEAIIKSDEKFDLVMTDVQLARDAPDGGLAVGKLVAERRPGTPVLYTSGRPDTENIRSLFVEPSAFLRKIYNDQELIDAVSMLLQL